MQIGELVKVRQQTALNGSVELQKEVYEEDHSGIVERFKEVLNKEREGTQYEPLTWSAVNGQLRGFKGRWDKLRLYNHCSNARSFSAAFWGEVKRKRNGTTNDRA